MKRRPRKIIMRVVVFLLLGAIVNVAVAWGCRLSLAARFNQAVHISDPQYGYDRQALSHDDARDLLHQYFPDLPIALYESHGTVEGRFGWMNLSAAWVGEESADGEYDIHLEVRAIYAGWPLHSLQSYWMEHDSKDSLGWHRGRFEIPNWLRINGIQNLPTIPLWPGFAINTIFYAAILWLLFFAPGMIKRSIRRRRGLCPACAYPVGTSPVCTECGKAVSAKGLYI